jgi:hypothetical protein
VNQPTASPEKRKRPAGISGKSGGVRVRGVGETVDASDLEGDALRASCQ